MKVYSLEEITSCLDLENAIAMQEEGFALYSEGKVTVPPVGYMNMGEKVGEVHIKYGWIEGDGIFCVKIAGAYAQNEKRIQGVTVVFDAKKGAPLALLQDEGYLTSLRTAIAGLLAAKFLAPKTVSSIGIIGTGTQARLQAKLLKQYTGCDSLFVWGRKQEHVDKYIADMLLEGFRVRQAKTPGEIGKECNLIVTTTSSRTPLLYAEDILPGTHITAVGADAPGKQELDPKIFNRASLCAVDSKSQCLDHGEIVHVHKSGFVDEKNLIELGRIVRNPLLGRKSSDEITVADLTGVSVQDIQIAKSVLYPKQSLN